MGETNRLREILEQRGIDAVLSFTILENYNAGKYNYPPLEVSDIPGIDGRRIIDMTHPPIWEGDLKQAISRLTRLGLSSELLQTLEGWPNIESESSDDRVSLKTDALYNLGVRLYPLLAYGILNGGMATSYADGKKNRGFHAGLFELNRKPFETMAQLCRGKSKGVTPAFVNPDGTPGPSFIELKMRHLLLKSVEHQKLTGSPVHIPLFQMTGQHNDETLKSVYLDYEHSPLLKELIGETGVPVTQAMSGVQPLVAAYTHGDEGTPKRIFTQANGGADAPLPLPGGHGQNFLVLKGVYQELLKQGRRFVYLTNVDNTGSTVDPVSLALLALSGAPAGFDFAFRTPVDVKGGVLIVDGNGRLNCADIGAGISEEQLQTATRQGKPVLFNCATGLFDLAYLVEQIDFIIQNLPVRFSDQDKDAGRYSQAEQVTWEVIGLLDNPLVFAVDKFERFLAAKLLQENLMTSGLNLDHPDYPGSTNPAKDLRSLAGQLHSGLKTKLKRDFALELRDGRWQPQ